MDFYYLKAKLTASVILLAIACPTSIFGGLANAKVMGIGGYNEVATKNSDRPSDDIEAYEPVQNDIPPGGVPGEIHTGRFMYNGEYQDYTLMSGGTQNFNWISVHLPSESGSPGNLSVSIENNSASIGFTKSTGERWYTTIRAHYVGAPDEGQLRIDHTISYFEDGSLIRRAEKSAKWLDGKLDDAEVKLDGRLLSNSSGLSPMDAIKGGSELILDRAPELEAPELKRVVLIEVLDIPEVFLSPDEELLVPLYLGIGDFGTGLPPNMPGMDTGMGREHLSVAMIIAGTALARSGHPVAGWAGWALASMGAIVGISGGD